MKELSITDPLYQSTIRYLIGGTEEELYALIRARHGQEALMRNKHGEGAPLARDENDAGTDAMQFHINGAEEFFYVWLATATPDLVWHETMHLTFDVLTCRGIAYSDECEDAFAYWGGAVFAEVVHKLMRLYDPVHRRSRAKA